MEGESSPFSLFAGLMFSLSRAEMNYEATAETAERKRIEEDDAEVLNGSGE